MKEIKIWAIGDASEVKPLEPKVQVDTESFLEETLVKNPQLLIPGLRLVGRQTPTPTGEARWTYSVWIRTASWSSSN